MDSIQAVRDFLADFDQRRGLPPHTSLPARLEDKLSRLPPSTKFAVRGPMHLAVLRKLQPRTSPPSQETS
jgi:hypothetical protein